MKLRGDVSVVFAVVLMAVVCASVAWRLTHQQAPGTAGGGATQKDTRRLQPLVTSPGVEAAGPDGPGAVVDAPDVRQTSPLEPEAFDVERALATVRDLESFGPRAGGSDAEGQAAVYLRDRLSRMGLDARIDEFDLPNGTTSRNVVARIPGSTDVLFVLGAHMDTKPPSPGANDNASGCAALLEVARLLAGDSPVPTVEVVFFGSEETIGEDPNAHHFGSRHRVSQMTDAERSQTAGMLSIDMIGYGPEFHSRTMGVGPAVLSDMVLARARAMGIRMTYRKDPGASGWSDHEAYEKAGIPVAWLEWRDDPVYHTAGDTSERLSSAKIASTGRLVLELIRGLDGTALDTLTGR